MLFFADVAREYDMQNINMCESTDLEQVGIVKG